MRNWTFPRGARGIRVERRVGSVPLHPVEVCVPCR